MKKFLVIGIAVFATAVTAAIFAWPRFFAPQPAACTQETKLCPDGSSVGRTGPQCEFAACPSGSADASWKTFTDAERGISFRYPENPAAKYMDATGWPPQVQILNEPFTCTEAGSETARAGKTEKRMVDNRTYCVTTVTGGAAGSIYSQYAYAFPEDGKTAILIFSIRYVQCGNYGDPQKTECQNLRTAFDLDSVVDTIAKTLTLTSGTKAETGIITGMVLLGPTCPVEACAPRPYQTTIRVTKNGSPFATTKSDTEGKYEISLPAGTYALEPAGGNILPRCETREVVVEANKTQEINLSCDTGIR